MITTSKICYRCKKDLSYSEFNRCNTSNNSHQLQRKKEKKQCSRKANTRTHFGCLSLNVCIHSVRIFPASKDLSSGNARCKKGRAPNIFVSPLSRSSSRYSKYCCLSSIILSPFNGGGRERCTRRSETSRKFWASDTHATFSPLTIT